jgi:adenine-specific DNA-methyltransferase
MATGMRDTPVSPDHEYVLSFVRNIQAVQLFGFARRESDFQLSDNNGRYRSTDLTVGMTREMRPNQFYAIKNPDTGKEYWPPGERVWRFEPSTMEKHIHAGNIIWPDNNPNGRMSRPRFKIRFDGGAADAKTNPISTWINLRSDVSDTDSDGLTQLTAGLNQEATKELRDIFGEQILDYPKPNSFVKGFCAIGSRAGDVVLDFFAGSGTTAHAVLDLNKQDGGNRKFILVQLPEPTDRKDYPTIADITKERVRRVIKKLDDEDAQTSPQLALTPAPLPQAGEGRKPERGFRVFKLAESNFKPWNAEAPKDAEALAEQLELHVDHIRNGRNADDILYEILLKSGFPLTTPVEPLTFPPHPGPHPQGERAKIVYSVAGGVLFICLERELNLELMRAMAEKKPERVVCLDEGFAGNDQLKANAVQLFRTKGITSFKTV